MEFQQIRGATSIITFAGKRFLFDPFFAPCGSTPPVPSPYNDTPNPLVELPLSVEEIVRVDAVIVTHMHHFDHFDELAAQALPKSMPMFVQNAQEAEDMEALGFAEVAVLSAEGTPFGPVTLYRTEALHGEVEKTQHFYEQFGVPADACGVVFRAEAEPVLYMAGDTVWFSGVADALARFQPDVVGLNAAWAQFYDGSPILMGPDDIEKTAQHAPKARFIATHMDAVNHARLSRAALQDVLKERGLSERFVIPADGQTLRFES